MKTLILSLMLIISAGQPAQAQNFIGANEEIREAAELWRARIAIFWMGKEFPKWASPCRITSVNAARTEGYTNFKFYKGEVYDWDMQIKGTPYGILADGLPHEIHHTVMATIARRPLTRWLDEGLAQLWESEETQQNQTSVAYKYRHSQGQVFRQFDAVNYPTDKSQTTAMYATGYTLIEWLLTQHDKEVILEFIKDPRKPSVKFETHFILSPQEAEREWLTWLEANYQNPESYLHYTHVVKKVTSDLPILHVVSTQWCGPCRQFWNDVRLDRGFKKAIESRVNILEVDGDKDRQWADSHGVNSYPSFLLNGKVVFISYGSNRLLGMKQRKHNFIDRLDQALKKTITPSVIVQPKIDLGQSAPLIIPDPGLQDKLQRELQASKLREAEVKMALALLTQQITDLNKKPRPVKVKQPTKTPIKTQDTTNPDVKAETRTKSPSLTKTVNRAKQWAWDKVSDQGWLIIGAAVAGPLGMGLTLGGQFLHRRLKRRKGGDQLSVAVNHQSIKTEINQEVVKAEGGVERQKDCQLPFPRHLDEANQLRELRQSEGRVAALDALIGMTFSDLVEDTLETSENTEEKNVLNNLRNKIMDRVDEIAPIRTPVKGAK